MMNKKMILYILILLSLPFTLINCLNTGGCEASIEIASNHTTNIPHGFKDGILDSDVENASTTKQYQISYGGSGSSLTNGGHSHFFEITALLFQDLKLGKLIKIESSACSQNCGLFGTHTHFISTKCNNQSYIDQKTLGTTSKTGTSTPTNTNP